MIPDPPRSEAVASLLLELRPRIQRIVTRFGIPAAEAEALLRETVVALVRHWRDIESPTTWLLATFEEKCSVYSRRHPATDPDQEPTELSDPEPGATERAPEDVWLDLERTLEAVRECLAEGDAREARARAARSAGEAAPESSEPPATREGHRR